MELKHGRVAMLAALGFPIAEQFHPLFGGEIDVPSYIAFQVRRRRAIALAPCRQAPHTERLCTASFYRPLSLPLHHTCSSAARSAHQETPLQAFWPAVVIVIAVIEVFSIFSFNSPFGGGEKWSIRLDYESGDLGFDPLGLRPESAEEFKDL